MSFSDYTKALELIDQHPELNEFSGPCDLELVDKVEETLGVQLPLTFRQFLSDFGEGTFEAEEFYGIFKENFFEEDYHNIVYNNLESREQFQHEKHLIIFYAIGDGTYLALDVSRMKDGECPVVICYCGPCPISDQLEVQAQDFGEMFLTLIQEAIEFSQENNE